MVLKSTSPVLRGGTVSNDRFLPGKEELIAEIAEETGFTKKDSDKALEAVIKAITSSLAKGNKLQLVGFGSFDVRKREARKGRNPQTGQEIDIAARKVPVFTAGKALKDAVDK